MNRNILLVEDDVKYRRSTILHLTAKNQDYVFYEAFSVSEAIEILNRENIQVILLDYKLSGNEEGTELLKYVKDLEKEYRVIFLTAYAPPDDLDVYIYLPKDLGPEPLSNAVENAFDDLQVTEEKKNIHKLAEAPLDMTPSKKPETDIVSEHRRPAPQAAPVAAHLHSDKWTLDDQLGYSLYAKGITEFMFHEQTKPPLTIGILAPWGHGKTTLMRLIEDEIVIEDELKETTAKHTRTTDVVKTPSRASGATYSNLSEWIESSRSLSLDSLKHLDRLKHPTIWFNAWKFQNSEQLWAGLAQAIITQLVDQIPDAIDREKFWFLLQAERIDFNKIRRDIHKAVLEQFLPSLARWCIVGLLGIAILIASAILGPALGGVLKLFGLGTGVLSLIGSIISWSKSKKKMLEKSLEGKFVRYVSEPGYEEKMGYFAEVERDVRRVFKLLVDEEKPAVVFVDDLDRCSPGKTAEVIEAINLFLSGDFPTCYFVMGMDAQVVAASLDVAHEKLAHRLKPMTRSYGSLGWYFMEKIVQLPFVIPNLSENQRSDYLAQLMRQSPVTPGIVQEEIMTAEKDIEEAFQLRLPATDILKHKDDLKKLRHAKPEKFREFAERAIALGARQFSDDDPEVQEQFTHYSPYLDTPRILKRFANLYRFYRFTQWSRELQGFQTATPSELGSWLVTMLRWPQIVRWIQWPGKTQRKIGHTSLEKARHFDSMIKETDSFEEWIEQMDGYDLEHIDGIKDKRLYDFWSNQQQKNHSLSRAVEVGIW